METTPRHMCACGPPAGGTQHTRSVWEADGKLDTESVFFIFNKSRQLTQFDGQFDASNWIFIQPIEIANFQFDAVCQSDGQLAQFDGRFHVLTPSW